MDVSIIIVNYNTYNLTLNCIESIIKNTDSISYEIILVDNASKDGSKELFSKDKRLKYIYLEENIGFGRANNVAAEYASGKFLFFLNSDTLLLNNAINILYQYLIANPKVAICGGNLYDGEMQLTHSFSKLFPSIVNDIDLALNRKLSKLIIKGGVEYNTTNQPVKVAYITGADLMIRKDIFISEKGFDPDFFMYFEETELSTRITNKGWDIMNIPSAKIIHLEGKSLAYSPQKSRMILKSKRLYFKKTYNKFYCIIADIIYWIINGLGIIFYLLFDINRAHTLYKKQVIFTKLILS